MRIYLFRHGEALSKGDPSVSSDAERPLIEEGVRRTRQSAEGLVKLGLSFDAILTSPWMRARQTAQIVAEVLEFPGKPEVMEQLAGDRSVEDAIGALATHDKQDHIMLVGHQPLLGEIAAYCLSLSTAMQVDMKKSGIVCVEVARIPPKNPGTLIFAMSAKQLRLLRDA